MEKLYTYTNNEFIYKTINVGAFEDGLSRVHHQLCIGTGKNYQTIAPLSVPQDTTTQNQLVVIQRISLVLPFENTLIFAEKIIGSFTCDISCNKKKTIHDCTNFNFHKFQCSFNSQSMLWTR